MELTQNELNYSHYQIKRLTPYLDNIRNNVDRALTLKQRAYCWYFAYNGNIKADAYRRAYHMHYNKISGELEEIKKKEVDKMSAHEIKNRNMVIATKAVELHMNPYIVEAIELIIKEIEKEIKKNVPQSMLEQLTIQATYDPSMFFTPTGKVAFASWNDIPQKYRCCVEGIEQKCYGKNADVTITTIKLVDRDKARKYLLKIAPGILEAEKLEVLHKTLDKNGKEIGLDVTKLTDEELLEKYNELTRSE